MVTSSAAMAEEGRTLAFMGAPICGHAAALKPLAPPCPV